MKPSRSPARPSAPPEATLRRTEHGPVPQSQGWFVVNAREARWLHSEELGSYCGFEGENARFSQLGININVLPPGEPMCMYHGENAQEDFLVVSGDAILIVEGEERPLRAWDFVHCPEWTAHVIVGAGDSPCVVIAVGARPEAIGQEASIIYPVNDAALAHEAGVEQEARSGKEAYARFVRPAPGPYRTGDLPDTR